MSCRFSLLCCVLEFCLCVLSLVLILVFGAALGISLCFRNDVVLVSFDFISSTAVNPSERSIGFQSVSAKEMNII